MNSKDIPQALGASDPFVQLVSRSRRARRASISLAAVLAALSVSGAGVSNAATTPKLPVPRAEPQLRAQAPIGHRQPRPQDLPPSVLRDEEKGAGANKTLDQKLEICRKC
jgi:hypothetical protein